MSVKLDDAGLQHCLRGSFDGPFLGTPTLIGPWGRPAALPRCQGLTDSSNEACHRRARDRSGAGTELQSAYVTSKEFWFLSSSEGVKRRPLWETGSPGLPLNISPFTACQFSVLEMHRRQTCGGWKGWLWWIFHNQKETKRQRGPLPRGIRFGCCHTNADFVILCNCQITIIVLVAPLEKEKKTCQVWTEKLKLSPSISHACTSLLPVMEGCWRAVEPQKTHPHFVLLFTISGFRTL